MFTIHRNPRPEKRLQHALSHMEKASKGASQSMPLEFFLLRSQLSAILRELDNDSESLAEHTSVRDFDTKTLCGAEANKVNALGLSNLDADVPDHLATALFHRAEAMKACKYFGSALWTYLAAFKARFDISEWPFIEPPASYKLISSIPEEVLVQCSEITEPWYLQTLTAILIASADMKASERFLELILPRIGSPGFLDAAINIAITLKKSDVIERLCQTCKAANHRRWDQRWFLAQSVVFLDNPGIAVDLLDFSHQQSPWVEQAYLLRLKARSLPTLAVRPVAIKIYQDGMRCFPRSYKIVERLSRLCREDKSESAIEVLQTARRIPVMSFEVAQLLISLYQRYGRNSEAFNKALRLTVAHKSQWETYEVMWDVQRESDMTIQESVKLWISLSTQDSPH